MTMELISLIAIVALFVLDKIYPGFLGKIKKKINPEPEPNSPPPDQTQDGILASFLQELVKNQPLLNLLFQLHERPKLMAALPELAKNKETMNALIETAAEQDQTRINQPTEVA